LDWFDDHGTRHLVPSWNSQNLRLGSFVCSVGDVEKDSISVGSGAWWWLDWLDSLLNIWWIDADGSYGGHDDLFSVVGQKFFQHSQKQG
jgi:hypothetical protein